LFALGFAQRYYVAEDIPKRSKANAELTSVYSNTFLRQLNAISEQKGTAGTNLFGKADANEPW